MKTKGLVLIFLLLYAAAAQAVNTVTTLQNNGWENVQQGLVSRVGPSAEGPIGSPLPDIGNPGPSKGLLDSVLGIPPGLLGPQSEEQIVLPLWQGQIGNGATGPSLPGSVDNLAGGMDLGGSEGWNVAPKEYSDAGLVDAGVLADHSAFADLDLTDTTLPSAEEASFMEIVVFPALGALLIVFVGVVLVLRFRRRKVMSETEQLLQV